MAERVENEVQIENAGAAVQTPIQTFRRHLVCSDPACRNQLLEAPVMLPCLHRFCTACLEGHLDKQLNALNQIPLAERRDAEFRCPCDHCKEPTGITIHDPPHDIPPMDEFLEKMVNLFKLEEELVNREKPCEECDPENRRRATRVCLHDKCENLPLCEPCSKHHSRARASRNHEFLKVEDLRRVVDHEEANNENLYGLHLKPWRCTRHDDEPRSMYCRSHDKVFCVKCGIENQCISEHNPDFLPLRGWLDQYPEHKPEVEAKLNNLKVRRDEFRQGMDNIEARMNDLQATVEQRKRQINERHQRLVAELNRQRDALLEKAERIHKRKKDRLDIHYRKVKNAHQVMNETSEFIDSFLKFASDIEFYYERTRISTCLDNVAEKVNEYCITPQEGSMIELSPSDGEEVNGEIKESFKRTMGRLYSTPCVPHFTLDNQQLQELRDLRAGNQTTVTVICRDVCGTPLRFPPRDLPDLCAHLEVVDQEVTPNIIHCRVTTNVFNGNSQYLITMLPPRHGQMNLHIYHLRPKPFPLERIKDCPNEGFQVNVQGGLLPFRMM